MHDAAVVQRLYSDVDLWLRARNPHLHNSVQAFGIALPPLKRLDFVLSLLARQVADPGINDRRSDAPSHMSGITEDCAGVAYVNLDIPDIDLNEVAYYEKEGRARILVTDRNTVDTTGSTYVRVSATLGPWESFEMRTVQSPQKPQTGFNSHGIEAQ